MLDTRAFDRPALADGVVRFAGEAVAVVVAEQRAQAVDAAELVEVVYDPLTPVLDPEHGADPGVPVVFPEHGTNVAFELDRAGVGDTLEGADVVVRGRFVNQRVSAAPMETDGVIAVPEAGGGVTLWASTQRVHQVRDDVAAALGLAQEKVRVVTPRVGGGFGAKYDATPEDLVVAALALQLGRPVAWTQTRSECLVSMVHGRAQVQHGALGVRADGTFVAIEADLVGDAGAYPGIGALMPNATLLMLPGPYRFARAAGRGSSTVTNTTPVGAYRGAGRPEACVMLERLVELAAAELGTESLELRRRNLYGADEFPHPTPTGLTYDSGDPRQCLDTAAAIVDYDGVRREQQARRARGDVRALGVAIALWTDCTPMNRPGEFVSVRVADAAHADDGDDEGVRIEVRAGTCDSGQGHQTAWGVILAGVLGVPAESVHLVPSDTAEVPQGEGTGSARSLQLAGNAVAAAGALVLDQARRVAGHLLEAAPEDIAVTADGRLAVAGTPARAVTWAEVARAAAEPASLPPDVAASVPGGLAADFDFEQRGPTFPGGAHAAVVEVDVETGGVRLLRFVAVDDCGRVINPVLVAGQQHGGIVQGIAQALYEGIEYDGDGNPLTTTFADYLVPSAAELPGIEVHTIDVTSPVNPLGAKGIGQGGAIGSTAAVQNAVMDALAHLGVRHIDLPLAPERVWRAINAATTGRRDSS
jgi:carbon-monoxide dehydrogenase large subunit